VELRGRLGSAARQNEPLARYTSSRVGGTADLFYVARTRSDLTQAVDIATRLGVPWRLIGGASNLLVSDAGVGGLVVKVNTSGTRLVEAGSDRSVLVEAEAGCMLAAVARQVSHAGLSGLEWASNVPGTVGASVVNNSGAFGSSTAEHLVQAVVHTPGIGAGAVQAAELGLAYRTSRLKRGEVAGVVLQATYRVTRGDPAASRRRLHEVQEQRRRTQPSGYSLGSMFTNPPGDSAGRLIEVAGLKGRRVGGAEVSHLHANFILNRTSASTESPPDDGCDGQDSGPLPVHGRSSMTPARARDILDLIKIIQETVWADAHVWLIPEVQFVGRWKPSELRTLYESPAERP